MDDGYTKIEDDLKNLPKSPGVYLMHDDSQQIIYIGKAKNLKNRVSQYFRSGKKSPKIEKMVTLIAYFEYIVTDSEVEALILENNLIKEHRPRYNTMLKDDKTYPYIRVTVSEEFPRLIITRRIKRDKDRYFGPYPDVGSARRTAELLTRVYKLRTCNLKFPRDFKKDRPCLNHHIGRCDAPCTGELSQEEYNIRIKEVCRFLDGTGDELIKEVRTKMKAASDALEFEKAGEFKELLEAAERIALQQKMEYAPKDNRDILGLAKDGFDAVMQIYFVREGKLIGREHFYLSLAPGETDEDTISSFIKQYYSGTPFLPGEILLPHEIEDGDTIGEWLSKRGGHRVNLLIPKKGQKEKLVELAEKNAKLTLDMSREKLKRQEARTKGAASQLSDILGIAYAKRIESYDISNISGVDSVGSMVVFEDGKPKKNDYRKFRIKTVTGPDDVASMKEVISRRLEHKEKYPNLMLIDGGKGQVNAVLEVIQNIGAEIPVCGMIKDDRHRTRGMIFNGKEIIMDRSKESFKLLTRIQDETHRFAIEYHRSLRSKGQTRSVLDNIEGIGPKRRIELMKYFKSIDSIRNASVDEISKVPAMNIKAAEKVYDFFNSKP